MHNLHRTEIVCNVVRDIGTSSVEDNQFMNFYLWGGRCSIPYISGVALTMTTLKESLVYQYDVCVLVREAFFEGYLEVGGI